MVCFLVTTWDGCVLSLSECRIIVQLTSVCKMTFTKIKIQIYVEILSRAYSNLIATAAYTPYANILLLTAF